MYYVLPSLGFWYHSLFLGYDLYHTSSKLSKIFKEVSEKISQQVPKSSFCADILEKKGIFRVMNNIRLLQKEELVKHCRQHYQWSEGLEPGDVIGVEVQVTSEKKGLEVICIFCDFYIYYFITTWLWPSRLMPCLACGRQGVRITAATDQNKLCNNIKEYGFLLFSVTWT